MEIFTVDGGVGDAWALITKLCAEHRFQLGRVPIQPWLVFAKKENNWLFAWSRHHALHDARTLDMQGDELSQLYVHGSAAFADIEAKRTLENSYGSYMQILLNHERLTRQQAFWRRYLDGIGPAVWPPPSEVPLTFCKDISEYGFHVAEWRGSLNKVAKGAGVTMGAVVRAAFAISLAEREKRDETIVYEVVDGTSGTGLNPWGCCIHINPTRIQVSQRQSQVR